MGVYLQLLWKAMPTRMSHESTASQRPSDLLERGLPNSINPEGTPTTSQTNPHGHKRNPATPDFNRHGQKGTQSSMDNSGAETAISSQTLAYESPVPSLVDDIEALEDRRSGTEPYTQASSVISTSHCAKGKALSEKMPVVSLTAREWAIIIYGVDLEAPVEYGEELHIQAAELSTALRQE